MNAIIEKADVKVTDDEAKTVKVYKLVFTTKKTDSKTGKEVNMTAKEKAAQLKKAKEALKAIKKGQSVKAVAKKYEVDTTTKKATQREKQFSEPSLKMRLPN